ncbi:MAG TPA: orotidine 5'-phosphate decarboxylase / HUMPS family protein, partial [Acidimicrobiia bacterium]|nr:orotidine 5'-phosphate decarboxylase / HUMPS family protein [Acidimicrobiia bacterium]
AGGGQAAIRAAVEGLGEGAAGNPAGILGVTVLTSMDATQLSSTGIITSIARQVARLAKLASAAGAEGVVLAPRELGDARQAAPDMIRVTPGIRDRAAAVDDQARTASAEEAIGWGADFIVVGRPITRATDPVAALQSLLARINRL